RLPDLEEVSIRTDERNGGRFFAGSSYGFMDALVWLLDFEPEPGDRYRVVVERNSNEILSYEVYIVRCTP
ncbi:MAG: hypothetical protein AAFS10_28475, partial [Myxococcota bacterium]